MMPLLEVDGLAISHAEGHIHRRLVTDVSFKVGLGETVGLVGESGSGKSLTARALVSLLQPELRASGSIRFDGVELVDGDGRVSSRVRGRDIGLLMQDPFTMLNGLLATTSKRHSGYPRSGRGSVGTRCVPRLPAVSPR